MPHQLEALKRTIQQHEDWRLGECLNLIPSENRGSDLMKSMYLTDFGNRYTAPDRFYRGTRYADELVAQTQEIARKVFNARYADVSLLSGHVANAAVLLALTRPGDRVASTSPDDGGYPGISQDGLGGLLGLQNVYFPYDRAAVGVDLAGSVELLKSEKPAVAFFGASHIVFPYPVRRLSDAAEGMCVYDGSHVLGLIAGGEFQDPLREGCPILIGSTHKSLPGPQGGIILSNNEEAFEAVSGKVFPGVVDNVHLNRVAALAVSLIEMQEFGKQYAQAVVKNAQALANALAAEGVNVRGAGQGYTRSHQVLLDYDQARLKPLSVRLEQANIIVDEAGRVGTAEATRMGYGPGEMEAVAELMAMVILGKKAPDFVQKKVKTLVKQFQQPRFVL
ncbi:MAG: serine hydroxymethyltransferase [Nitrososphaerota archaeon]|nr:serine hydroxymethyltransferase [Nitrososphaerota archaeon]